MTDQEVSLDEQVARSYAQEQTTDLVVNVVDASNLERNLYLTTQLAEMQVPLLLAGEHDRRGRRQRHEGRHRAVGAKNWAAPWWRWPPLRAKAWPN